MFNGYFTFDRSKMKFPLFKPVPSQPDHASPYSLRPLQSKPQLMCFWITIFFLPFTQPNEWSFWNKSLLHLKLYVDVPFSETTQLLSLPRPLGFTAHTPLYNPWGCLYLWTLFYNLGPWAGQETLGKFPSVKREKLKLGRWPSGQEGGCILNLRLIWDTGIMSKIQPNPTHCPWDTCHLLCLVPKLFPLFRELPILWLRAHYHTQEAENVCGWLPHHVTQAPLAKHPSPGIWSEGVQRQWPWECGLPRLVLL